MCSCDEMTNALLAMSLSYYYVMEEQMEKEIRTADKILATLIACQSNNVPPKCITSAQCKSFVYKARVIKFSVLHLNITNTLIKHTIIQNL